MRPLLPAMATAALLVLGGMVWIAGCNREGSRVASVEELDRAIAEHAEELLETPAIHGVYRGETEAGAPCIKILVDHRSEEVAALVNRVLGGLPVIYSESGPLEPK